MRICSCGVANFFPGSITEAFTAQIREEIGSTERPDLAKSSADIAGEKASPKAASSPPMSSALKIAPATCMYQTRPSHN